MPPEQVRPPSIVESEPDLFVRHARAGLVIMAMIAGIIVLLSLPQGSFHDASLHELYRRLLFIPLLYAAFVYGRWGGLGAALLCSATLGAFEHDPTAPLGLPIDTLLEIAMFVTIGGLFGALRDNDQRRTRDLRQVSVQLEEAYKKLEERAVQLINIQDYTQSILRSITSGVLTVGPDGSVTTANPAAERMLGMSEFDMVPKAISGLFRDDGGIGGDVAKVLAGRLPLALREVTLVTSGGRSVHVQASTSRMRAVGGKILGAVVTIEDVSDVKALTEQLIRADRLAAMGELTAGVAHEVRNPLGVIRASVQLLEDAKCDENRIRDAAEIIKQEIDRLDKVIKALLDFGRPSTPTLVRCDIESVVDDVVMFTTRFATQSDVVVERQRSEDLPPVLADPDQLKQVFLNLVTNAVQAMGDSGGRIDVRTFADGDFVVVQVADDGPGISPADLPKVFDPFYSHREGGTGLGLTIVHRIVDEHGGHIEVSSSREGTLFTVSLPAFVDD